MPANTLCTDIWVFMRKRGPNPTHRTV